MCGKATGRHDRRGPLRITTEISPDDHRDYTRSLAGEGIEEAKALESARGLSRARFTMYLAMAAFFGALVWVVYGWGLDGLLDRPFVPILTLIGLLCVPVAIVWFMSERRKPLPSVCS